MGDERKVGQEETILLVGATVFERLERWKMAGKLPTPGLWNMIVLGGSHGEGGS